MRMEANDKEIVSMMRRDAETGFRMFMAKYGQAVYWHVRRMVVSHADAQDAAQEAFVRVYRNIGSYRTDSSFKAWVYRIATNEALRALSRNKGCEVSLDDKTGASIAERAADEYIDYTDLEAVRLQKAILTLPAMQQLAFNLRYYDEMDYDEIAEIAGSTVASVKVSYHVAKEKIVKYMNSND